MLDGQQRLTALNICAGAWHGNYRGWWKNPNAFPKRQLYLDLLWQPHEDNDDATTYRFEFLTEKQLEDADVPPAGSRYPKYSK